MTSRLFLTLLAFITGFTVQGAPAEARLLRANSAEIGAVVANATIHTAKVSAAVAGLDVCPARLAISSTGLESQAAPVREIPAVLVRIDRARE